MKKAKTKEPEKETAKTITFRYIGDNRENKIKVAVKDEGNNVVRFKSKVDNSSSPDWVNFYDNRCVKNEWVEIPFNEHHLAKLKGNHHFEVK